MPTLNLNQEQVNALRSHLNRRDDWGISPAEYSTAIAEVLAMLSDTEHCPGCDA